MKALEEGGAPFDEANAVTVCHAHHPTVEALRRRERGWRRCTHRHPYPGAREACERRLNRNAGRGSILVGG